MLFVSDIESGNLLRLPRIRPIRRPHFYRRQQTQNVNIKFPHRPGSGCLGAKSHLLPDFPSGFFFCFVAFGGPAAHATWAHDKFVRSHNLRDSRSDVCERELWIMTRAADRKSPLPPKSLRAYTLTLLWFGPAINLPKPEPRCTLFPLSSSAGPSSRSFTLWLG